MAILKIGLCIGDPNGIGPEIALKAAEKFLLDAQIDLQIIGDQSVIDFYLNKFPNLFPNSLNKIQITHVSGISSTQLTPGKVTAEAGYATIEYLKRGVQLAQSKDIDVLIACPHNETAVNMAGISFNGYPGKVAELTNTPKDQVFIMLVGGGLHIAHATLHEGVSSALDRLTSDLVTKAGIAACKALEQLGKKNPSLGIFGINPHAGENGLFGQEDILVTFPASEELKRLGWNASTPQGADVLLSENKHDVYLAMFHDQGHIPIKLISPKSAAAITIGTNILFSSVAHGTAMDIAGKGIASPTALINAIEVLINSIQ